LEKGTIFKTKGIRHVQIAWQGKIGLSVHQTFIYSGLRDI
jgi:hypothetical protein